MKKSLLYGALFGALLIPFSVLGLIFGFIETITQPFTFVPVLLINALMDTATANGLISLTILAVVSAMFYAAIFGIAYKAYSLQK